MVEIGERPILWHIMKIYSYFGFNDFVVCLGYKGYVIKEYFSNYFLHMSDVTFDMSDNSMKVHQNAAEPWRVTLVDTGAETQTGGRIRRVGEYVRDETFMLTYGDGVANINIPALLEFHRKQDKLVTLTAVRPAARFGQMVIEAGRVVTFKEKPQIGEGWINGGFFVLQPGIVDYIAGDQTSWEFDSLETLTAEGQVTAYQHEKFWQSMDTIRDVHLLEKHWSEGKAPWKIWK